MADYSTAARQRSEVLVNDYVRSVYNWMCIGLALTGGVAYWVAHTPAIVNVVYGNTILLFALIIAELGLVVAISARIGHMSPGTATSLFILYAALNGVTLSFIFLIYTSASIISTFFICSGTFLACSIYGWMTKKDLMSFGGFLFMGLIGIIIASVVNMFIVNEALQMIINYIGVFVFMGLTAYHTQQVKNMARNQPADADAGVIRKGAILGALSLYLAFINLFLFMLRIFGGSRD